MLHIGAMVFPMFAVESVAASLGQVVIRFQAMEVDFGRPTVIALSATAFTGGTKYAVATQCAEQLKGLMDPAPVRFEYVAPSLEERRVYEGWFLGHHEVVVSLLLAFVWSYSPVYRRRRMLITRTLGLMVLNGVLGWPGLMFWRVPIANKKLADNLTLVGWPSWAWWTAYVISMLCWVWFVGAVLVALIIR
jgi:hypothetical protein